MYFSILSFIRRSRVAGLGLLLCLLAVPLQVTAKGEVSPVSSETVVQMIIGLVFVLGLIAGLAWVVKRLGMTDGSFSPSMRVVSSLSLSAREKVVIVQVAEQQFLIGVAPGQVTCLHDFDGTVVDARSSAPAMQGILGGLLQRPASFEAAK